MKLTNSQRKQLAEATCKGKTVKFVYPDGENWSGKVVDEVEDMGEYYKSVLQRIEPDEGYGPFNDGSRCAYRFGYYVYSLKSERIVWAQRALMVSSKECQHLLAEAEKRGWEAFQ